MGSQLLHEDVVGDSVKGFTEVRVDHTDSITFILPSWTFNWSMMTPEIIHSITFPGTEVRLIGQINQFRSLEQKPSQSQE